MRQEKLPPAELSRELRLEENDDLRRRRRVVGLSLLGAAIGGVVTAYQTGLIKRLPDILPGKFWNAEKVDASDYAYKRLNMPDAPLMILTYGATAALAAAGGRDRANDDPALPIALAAKAAFDFLTCLKLAREEWEENEALCSWCQLATAISGTTLAISLPEAAKAAGLGRAVA